VQIPKSERIYGYADILFREEGSGILNYFLKGCYDWQDERLDPIPTLIARATEEYRKSQDTIGRFFSECTKPAPNNQRVPGAALYAAYSNWCDDNKEWKERSNEFFAIAAARNERRTISNVAWYHGLEAFGPHWRMEGL
jgi:phage/plasmid-associated DNA primase